jgi:hypothetical protein
LARLLRHSDHRETDFLDPYILENDMSAFEAREKLEGHAYHHACNVLP